MIEEIKETIEIELSELGISLDPVAGSRLASAVETTVGMVRELSPYGRPSTSDRIRDEVDRAVKSVRADAATDVARLEGALKEMTESRNDWRRAFYDLQRERAA